MSDGRKLYIDCQVFQYNAWNRGMGRYTLKLIEALEKEGIELVLIFNKAIPMDRNRLKAVREACPKATILPLKLSRDPNKYGGWQRLQKVCSAELDKQLRGILKTEDTYLIASNFSLAYCSAFPSLECTKALLFYDLTPYLHWEEYKRTPDFEPKKYFAQFATVFAADQLWAISESAADEAKYWLGLHADKVQNIRGASIRNLHEPVRRPSKVATSKFILCPSADGPHKNNENAARAFADFNNQVNNEYKLVITSDFSEQSKSALGSLSKDIIFSGHVSDGELSWLYQNCEAVLFASKTEGLGLPILEAVAADKKVICSDIKVFKEISDGAFYFADPNRVQSITEALSSALMQADNWDQKKKAYPNISQEFSWQTVAQTCKKLISEPSVSRQGTHEATHVIWYADSDKRCLPRDLAEILYALQPALRFRAMRDLTYAHKFPSYLVEMGVADHGLDAQTMPPAAIAPIYIVDDSVEAARLLFYALLKPGLVLATFSKQEPLKNINKYLKANYEGRLDALLLLKLVQTAGNDVVYQSDFSTRGDRRFIDESESLSTVILREAS